MTTHFPHGLSASFVIGAGGLMLPVMGGGALTSHVSKAFFVDGANGAVGAAGTTPEKAVSTVSEALGLCTSGRGDVVYLLNNGAASGSSREDAAITWSKDNTHLVGLCSPVPFSKRSRIVPNTTTAYTSALSPYFTVSGDGCIFANVQIAPFGAGDGVAGTGVSVTGDRNYFYNCHLAGICNADTGDEANAEDLLLSGCQENVFEECVIGLDSVTRTAACANIRTASQAARNIFRRCLIPMWADADAPRGLIVPSSGLDRWLLFDRCVFSNPVPSSSTSQTAMLSVNASAGGGVYLHKSSIFGDAACIWHAASSNIFNDSPTPDGAGGDAGGEAPVVS